jgi:hypothetical protein
MKRVFAWVLAVAFWSAWSSASFANTHGCACVHNEVPQQISFRYKFGDGNWKNVKLPPGFNDAICWRYSDGRHSSPNLRFELDVDMTKGKAWTVYSLDRVQTPGDTCKVVPSNGHYSIKYRPGTNKQFIRVYKRGT